MYINTNISALNTLYNLSNNESKSAKTMEGLASGKRINRASDDAAGTAVAARMTTQIRGLNQSVRNANDGIAMLQTFEGALGSMQEVLQRMRELGIQSANGTYSDPDRLNLNAEFLQLQEEFDRISTSTKFNGNAYIGPDNIAAGITLQLSDVANDVLTVVMARADLATLNGGNFTGIDTQANAQTSLGEIDGVLDLISAERANLGGYMNRLEYTVQNLGNTSTNLSSAKSRIEDLDMASAMSELAKSEILTQSSVAMLGKANQAPQAILQLLGN